MPAARFSLKRPGLAVVMTTPIAGRFKANPPRRRPRSPTQPQFVPRTGTGSDTRSADCPSRSHPCTGSSSRSGTCPSTRRAGARSRSTGSGRSATRSSSPVAARGARFDAALADVEDRRLVQLHAARHAIPLRHADHARAAGAERQRERREHVGALARRDRVADPHAQIPVAVELALEAIGAVGLRHALLDHRELVLERVAATLQDDRLAGERHAVLQRRARDLGATRRSGSRPATRSCRRSRRHARREPRTRAGVWPGARSAPEQSG